MRVQKTHPHGGHTIMHGAFEVNETVHVCKTGCRHPSGHHATRRAASVTELLLPRTTVGYDVMVFVGTQRFVEHRQREEIRTALNVEHGVSLSSGTISELAARFPVYLRRLHEAHRSELRAALERDGGWPLHIDASGEQGRGVVLVARTGWRGWVLDAWKIESERADVIRPHLRSVVDAFGAPCAIMRDLGRAMIPACNDLVAELELAIPILGCHLHFLADVGTDLLDPSHAKLRALFRNAKVRPALRALARDLGRKLGAGVAAARDDFETWQSETSYTLRAGDAGIATVRGMAQWVLDYTADATYQSFPFDRPYLDFYDRCVKARRATDAFLRTPPQDRHVRRPLERLCRILDPVTADVPFVRVADTLRRRAALFDELRDALRLVPRTGGRNQAPSAHAIPMDDAIAELQDIQAQVEQFTASIRQRRPARGPAKDTREAIDVVVKHLEVHGDSLWGHVISLPDDVGGGIRLVDRTNNSLEGFFRRIKQGERRRSGRKSLAHDFESLPAEAALVHNLACPDYVDIVCGSLDRLPRAFADVDATERRTALATPPFDAEESAAPVVEIVTTSLPAPDRRLIRTNGMQQRMDVAARSRAPRMPARRSSGA
ncbi:MAG: hypothetical protein ACE5FI_13855 [Anaerolineales bacterium]